MTHITCQAERDDNAKVQNCPYAAVKLVRYVEDPWGEGEPYREEYTENQCGPSTYISAAKDKCKRCGLVCTY